MTLLLRFVVFCVVAFTAITSGLASDPLASWNDGETKRAILEFVENVTRTGSPHYVAPADRIATFDNDGCLWSEKPMYFQAQFAFDRINELAPNHPEWKTTEPFASVIKGDINKALEGGEHALLELVMATHAGMTTDQFDQIVTDWTGMARHPKTDRLYTEMVFQPMLELLDYLRDNEFKTFIVSGGGIDFIRPWSKRVYGIPPEQVVGSSVKTKFEIRDGVPVVARLPEINFIDDKEGKPVGIQQHIGKRPIFAAGNSDGDFQMLQWTTAGEGARFGLLIHHTDAEREWAYDRESSVGRLARGLDEGEQLGWVIVDMKKDWNQIYPQPESADGEPSGIIGKWLAEDIAGRGVVDRAQSTMQISPDGKVSGSTAVNRYSGQATIGDGTIKLGPLAVTRRAGPPSLMDQESKFLRALGKATRFRIDQNQLMDLMDDAGQTLVRFSPMED